MNNLITITDCKNCGQQIETYNFCPDCGAKKITKRITFKNLVIDFVDRFLNLDNSFIRTFVHLFTKPEEVVDGYINGLRKRYVNPFSYFAISVTITGFYGFIVRDRLNELLISSMGSFLSKEQLDAQINGLDVSYQYQSVLSFLLIPILAMMSRLVFLNYKKYNLTEHFVIYLYTYSHIVGLISLLLIPLIFLSNNYFTVAFLPFIAYFSYIGFALKRLYKMSLKKILIKTVLFLLILTGTFLLFVIGVAIISAIAAYLSAATEASALGGL